MAARSRRATSRERRAPSLAGLTRSPQLAAGRRLIQAVAATAPTLSKASEKPDRRAPSPAGLLLGAPSSGARRARRPLQLRPVI